jgi:hypothetical protein
LPDGSTLTAHAAWPLTEGDPRCHDGTSTYDPLEDCGENQVTGTPTLNPAFQTHCGDCHEHNNNFVGSGGDTTCIVCHAPGGQGTSGGLSRPAITTMFDRNSKHITVGSAGVTEPDCLVCHDQTGHSSDKIVGLNDLNGAGGPYDQPNATFSTTATGQGEAFAPHCLSCHDNTSADILSPYAGDNSTQTDESPFTGTDPAVFDQWLLDATMWNTAAAHNRQVGGVVLSDGATSIAAGTEVSCVGNGSNGCHASGHGSQNNKLLAAWDGVSDPEAADQAANGAIAPTDFCLNCHDGGVSAFDIEAQVAASAATDWGVPAAENYQYPNKHHDVVAADQAVSSSSLTCKDCHDPHRVQAVADAPEWIVSLPPPEVEGTPLRVYDLGTPASPAGTTYWDGTADVFFPYWDGTPEMTNVVKPNGAGDPDEMDYIQFCVTCHDGNPPPGVVMDASVLNMGEMWATNDQHGLAEGNNSSRGLLKPPFPPQANRDGTSKSAMNCSTCHGAHGSPNIFNLRESISVAGTQMSIGSIYWDNARFIDYGWSTREGDTSYTLPTNVAGEQEQYGFGAFCTFCHDVNHGSNNGLGCSNGHRHGGSNF